MAPLGRACAEQGAGGPETDPGTGWIVTPDAVEVDAPNLDRARATVW